jgi:hypothetical protein
MDYDAAKELHRELVYRLGRELSFYRSLFVLVERQRDAAKAGSEDRLALSYAELNTILGGLRESQFAIGEMRRKEPTLFAQAAAMPPVPELVREAEEILRAAHAALEEGRRAARERYQRLKSELSQLSLEHRALHAYKPSEPAGRFLDGTR